MWRGVRGGLRRKAGSGGERFGGDPDVLAGEPARGPRHAGGEHDAEQRRERPQRDLTTHTLNPMRSTINRAGLSAGKAGLASSIDLGQAECRDGAAAGAVAKRHLTAPLACQLPCDRQPETATGWAAAPGATAMETLEDRLGILGG